MNKDEINRLFLAALDKLEETSGEEADALVCRLITTPLYFADNLVGHCSICQRMIQYRPHAPKTPPKVCDDCAIMHKDSEAQVVITAQSKNDLRLFMKKKSEH